MYRSLRVVGDQSPAYKFENGRLVLQGGKCKQTTTDPSLESQAMPATIGVPSRRSTCLLGPTAPHQAPWSPCHKLGWLHLHLILLTVTLPVGSSRRSSLMYRHHIDERKTHRANGIDVSPHGLAALSTAEFTNRQFLSAAMAHGCRYVLTICYSFPEVRYLLHMGRSS